MGERARSWLPANDLLVLMLVIGVVFPLAAGAWWNYFSGYADAVHPIAEIVRPEHTFESVSLDHSACYLDGEAGERKPSESETLMKPDTALSDRRTTPPKDSRKPIDARDVYSAALRVR
jgi:hypothetical protein